MPGKCFMSLYRKLVLTVYILRVDMHWIMLSIGFRLFSHFLIRYFLCNFQNCSLLQLHIPLLCTIRSFGMYTHAYIHQVCSIFFFKKISTNHLSLFKNIQTNPVMATNKENKNKFPFSS